MEANHSRNAEAACQNRSMGNWPAEARNEGSNAAMMQGDHIRWSQIIGDDHAACQITIQCGGWRIVLHHEFFENPIDHLMNVVFLAAQVGIFDIPEKLHQCVCLCF